MRAFRSSIALVLAACASGPPPRGDARPANDASGGEAPAVSPAPQDAAVSEADAGAPVVDAATVSNLSYELRFIPSTAYNMFVRIGGGAARAVQLDTGSNGLFVPTAALGPDARKTTEECSISYVSSGNTLRGHRAFAKVEFIGSKRAGEGLPHYPTTVEMPLCAIDDFTGGMMGIGYGRGTMPLEHNAALQLEECVNGTTPRAAARFSINSGRRLIDAYDYLFDAQSGEVGFRRAK